MLAQEAAIASLGINEMANSSTTSLTVKYSTYINAPIDKVFQTITTVDGWNAWFTTEMVLEAYKGGKIKFIWRDWGVDHVDVEDGGEVLEVIPNSRFSFTWHSATAPTTVTFKLRQLAAGTAVELTDDGYLPEQIAETSGFADCCCGWGEALTLLKFFLEHGVTYGVAPRD
jgi:uncharacterized protein YndB with AHSA1/START domain